MLPVKADPPTICMLGFGKSSHEYVYHYSVEAYKTDATNIEA